MYLQPNLQFTTAQIPVGYKLVTDLSTSFLKFLRQPHAYIGFEII